MAIARERATRQGSSVIGCDHLLAGLAGVGRGVAATVMKDAGVDLTRLAADPTAVDD